jgi:hypothetical protein
MELAWLRRTDFFPPWQEDWSGLGSICIGTKSRNLGDALALTTLPAKLRARYPGLRITTFPRGFNRVVFRGNPAVSGISRAPRAAYGDDCNLGGGHLIQQKERFFGLPGPMHVARAFGLRSLVVLDHLRQQEIEASLGRRESEPYFLRGNWRLSPLYLANEHVGSDGPIGEAARELLSS